MARKPKLFGGANEFHKKLEKRINKMDVELVKARADIVKLRAEIQASSQKAVVTELRGIKKALTGGMNSGEETKTLEGLKAHVEKLKGTGQK